MATLIHQLARFARHFLVVCVDFFNDLFGQRQDLLRRESRLPVRPSGVINLLGVKDDWYCQWRGE